MISLIWLMMKEEFRFHTNFASKVNFFFFPVIALLVGAIGPLGIPNISESMDIERMVIYLHVSMLFYGFSIGSITFLGGDYIERRFGNVTFIRFTPRTLPWSFRKAFAVYYIQDLIFYLLLTIIPLTAGGMISSFIQGMNPGQALLLGFTFFLAFSTGLTFSFLSAGIFSRGKKFFIPYAVLLVTGIISMVVVPESIHRFLLPSYQFFQTKNYLFMILNILYVALLFDLGVMLIREYPAKRMFKVKSVLHEIHKRFSFSRNYSLMISKEIIDIKRSNTISKMLFSTVMPLLLITGMTWFIETGFDLELGFNTVFYASLIGYFQVVTYSWMNNSEKVDYYETLPVTVAKVIKSKIMVCVVIANLMSFLFVIFVSFLLKEVELVPIALAVMFFNILYCVTVIGYLTGLRTNSALFDIRILMKFSAFAMVPLIFMMAFSRIIDNKWIFALVSLVGVCIIMGGVVLLLYRAIDNKWKNERFVI